MIRFYADKLVAQTAEGTAARLLAIKAVREARVILGAIDTTLVRARDQVDALSEKGEGFLIGETESNAVAQRIPPILANGALEWRVENEAGEPAPLDEELPAETPVVSPSYESANVALILMALTEGSIGNSISGAQAISRTLAEDRAQGDPFWNEVLKCLLDSFPVTGAGVGEDVQRIAARLRSGGYE